MDLSKKDYLSIYETMVKIRAFEETASTLKKSGELDGYVHPYSGEEAIAAGVCSELTDIDCVVSTHRGHGHIIAKGGDIKKMFAELLGRSTGYSAGKSGSMHIADVNIGIIGANGIVGAGLPIANGVAFAMRYTGKDAVCVCFFGDGSSNRGTFHEALNLASVWNLPTIFVNENNNYASTTPQIEQMNITNISERAVSYGMTGVTVDGNDVLAVKQVTRDAIARIKSGAGQTLIECLTWRHYPHFVGDISSYKDPAVQAYWQTPEMDPIPRFEARMISEGVATPKEIEAVRNQTMSDILDALFYGKNSPEPKPEELLNNVYKEQ